MCKPFIVECKHTVCICWHETYRLTVLIENSDCVCVLWICRDGKCVVVYADDYVIAVGINVLKLVRVRSYSVRITAFRIAGIACTFCALPSRICFTERTVYRTRKLADPSVVGDTADGNSEHEQNYNRFPPFNDFFIEDDKCCEHYKSHTEPAAGRC